MPTLVHKEDPGTMANARTTLGMALPAPDCATPWPEPLMASPGPLALTWHSRPSPAWHQSALTSMSPILFHTIFIHSTKYLKFILKIHPEFAFNSIM